MVHQTLPPCPVCEQEGTVIIHEHLGTDGHFCVCSGALGCGSTFLLGPDGSISDIF